MERTNIGSLREHIGATVTIAGHLQTLRDQKKMQFLILRDLSGVVQVAFWKANNPELANAIAVLGIESVVWNRDARPKRPEWAWARIGYALDCRMNPPKSQDDLQICTGLFKSRRSVWTRAKLHLIPGPSPCGAGCTTIAP